MDKPKIIYVDLQKLNLTNILGTDPIISREENRKYKIPDLAPVEKATHFMRVALQDENPYWMLWNMKPTALTINSAKQEKIQTDTLSLVLSIIIYTNALTI